MPAEEPVEEPAKKTAKKQGLLQPNENAEMYGEVRSEPNGPEVVVLECAHLYRPL